MTRYISYILLVAILSISSNVAAWGQNGHRIIGKIADNHLTAQTREAINNLSDASLAQVSTWPDEMRSNPAPFWQSQSGKWHYININAASEFKPDHYHIAVTKNEVTDIYAAILKAISVLKSPTASVQDKQFYLRFLTHLVGDVHQPLHTGRSKDRGGNRIKVTFFGKETNLHSVWDTELVESQNLSYTEFVEFIDTQNPQTISKLLASEPKDWVLESFDLARTIYRQEDKELSYSYLYENMPVVKQRLIAGGIRLAGLLNHIFDKSAPVLVSK